MTHPAKYDDTGKFLDRITELGACMYLLGEEVMVTARIFSSAAQLYKLFFSPINNVNPIFI